MVFHLDKCIGCHTCSIACKNVWTDRKGAEYMWWNNVETKPGTGFPTAWEDQDQYGGGFQAEGGLVKLRSNGRYRGMANIFHNPGCRSSTTTTSRGRTATRTCSPRRPATTSPSRGRCPS